MCVCGGGGALVKSTISQQVLFLDTCAVMYARLS